MTTVLDKALKREITVDGAPCTLTVEPDAPTMALHASLSASHTSGPRKRAG